MPTREEMIRALQNAEPSREQMIQALQGTQPRPPQSQAPQRIVEDRMPEGLGWARFLVKNLGQDQMQSLAYLNREYGKDYDFDLDQGSIVAKKKGEKTWGKLDPSGFDIQDISDVAYDIPAGLASGAATALGGIGGSVLGLGVGGIPGAMAAGAGSSAALEGLRQGLGNLAGVASGVDKGSLVSSTALGALSPVLFGTGATAAGAASRLANNPKQLMDILYKAGQTELLEEAPEQAMELATKELMRQQKGISRLFPATGEFASGIQRETISNLAEEAPDIVKQTLKMPGAKMSTVEALDALKYQDKADLALVEGMQKEIVGAIEGTEQGLSSAYDAIKAQADEAGKTVDVSGAVNILKAKVSELLKVPKGEKPSLAAQKQAKKINAIINRVMSRKVVRGVDQSGKEIVERLPYENVSLTEAKNIEARLGDALKRLSDDPDNAVQKALGPAVDFVSKRADEIISEYNPQLVAEYREWYRPDGLKKKLESIIKTPEKLDSVLRTTGSDAKRVLNQVLQRIDANHGTNFNEYMKFMDARALFQRPSWTPITTKGTTSTTRTLTASALAKAVGNLFGQQVGDFAGTLGGLAISPKAIKGLSKANQAIGLKSKPAKAVANVRQTLLNQIADPRLQSMAGGAMQGAPATWLQMKNERGD